MMKILFVITGLFPGGAEKIVTELVRNLTGQGHTCTVISLQKAPAGKERALVNILESSGAEIIFLNVDLFHFWRIFSLKKILRAEKAHVVHSHLMHANLACRSALRRSAIPLINTIHIAEKRTSLKVRLLFLLDKLTYKRCTLYTAVSHAAARFHEKRCSLEKNSITVVLNGSDPVRQADIGKQEEFRKRYGLEKVQKIIGSLGRLDYQKGYDLFLESMEELHLLVPEGERWGVLLIGDGPERKKLEELIRQKTPLCPKLKFVLAGYQPDGSSYLGLLDLFVMPSRYEGFGLTLTEALSCGVPCLCSEADSLPELCALSPENTLCVPFVPGKMTGVYRKALTLPRTTGKILRDCRDMTADYLRLYRRMGTQE